jgi:hypothetical protein|tara:strand:- start:896 stop:1228 length:333 start_codon:yes stop_codon:yes gene_type:complete
MVGIDLLTGNLLFLGGALVISLLPLYFAVKLVGGEASLMKVILLSILLSAFSLAALTYLGLYASIASLLATSLVYRVAFKLTTGKAILVWILQYVIAFILTLLAVSLFAG